MARIKLQKLAILMGNGWRRIAWSEINEIIPFKPLKKQNKYSFFPNSADCGHNYKIKINISPT